MTATIAFQPPACSSVRASVVMSAVMPIAARTAATISAPTPIGLPHSAPSRSRRGHARSPSVATTPRTKLPIALPATIDHGGIGAATSRGSVPCRRSPRSERIPNWAVKNRKKMAMLAGKNVAGAICRSSDSASTRVIGLGVSTARAARAASSSGSPAARARRRPPSPRRAGSPSSSADVALGGGAEDLGRQSGDRVADDRDPRRPRPPGPRPRSRPG